MFKATIRLETTDKDGKIVIREHIGVARQYIQEARSDGEHGITVIYIKPPHFLRAIADDGITLSPQGEEKAPGLLHEELKDK